MTPFLVKIHNVQGWIVPPIVLPFKMLLVFLLLFESGVSCLFLLYCCLCIHHVYTCCTLYMYLHWTTGGVCHVVYICNPFLCVLSNWSSHVFFNTWFIRVQKQVKLACILRFHFPIVLPWLSIKHIGMDVHFETSIVQAHTLPSTHKNCIIVQCPVGTRVCVHR